MYLQIIWNEKYITRDFLNFQIKPILLGESDIVSSILVLKTKLKVNSIYLFVVNKRDDDDWIINNRKLYIYLKIAIKIEDPPIPKAILRPIGHAISGLKK